MRSLEGQRIVVTRAAHQAEELAAPLRAFGAEVLLLPTIGIAPPMNPEPLRRAVAKLNEYDWIVFTSANAVATFAAELPVTSTSFRARIATIGRATQRAAEQHGFHVSLTPAEYVAESLVEAFCAVSLNGRRILIPSASVTRDIVPGELVKLGANVEIVEAYRNLIPPEAGERAAMIFREPYPDWVLFASSSAIDNLVSLVGVGRLRYTRVASIGPITSKTVRKHGLIVSVEAGDHTIPGLIEALCQAAAVH